jgi:hypothetical protein
MELEYTPTPPKQQQQLLANPEFVLVKDVTGKPPPKRGPQVLKAVHQDKDGKPTVIEFKVPYPPKANCKKCRGRGYNGFVTEGSDRLLNICRKCYPVTK